MRWMWDTQDLWIDPARLIGQGQSTKFKGTEGDDRIHGTSGRDTFDVYQGGDDTLFGKGGNDTFVFGSSYDEHDFVNGGSGHDKIRITGDYTETINFISDRVVGVERIEFQGDRAYHSTFTGEFDHLDIISNFESEVDVDASGVLSGSLFLEGGASADILTGGAGIDTILGGSNISNGDFEILTGGLGKDTFVLEQAFDSPPPSSFSQPDLITDFSVGDSIFLPKLVSGRYHIGETENHVGDIVSDYDAKTARTTLNIFLNDDSDVDMVILLAGRYDGLAVVHASHLVVGGS